MLVMLRSFLESKASHIRGPISADLLRWMTERFGANDALGICSAITVIDLET